MHPILTTRKTLSSIFFPVLLFLVLPQITSGFYDPNTQRWLNRDPLGDDASLVYTTTRLWPRLDPPAISELADMVVGAQSPLGVFTRVNLDLFCAIGNNPVGNMDFFGLDFASCYADCIEKYRSPVDRSIGELCNGVGNKLVGPVKGRFPSRQGPGHPTTWQHKLGSKFGTVGSRIGKYTGWAGIIITVADGFYDLGLLVGCAADCAIENSSGNWSPPPELMYTY